MDVYREMKANIIYNFKIMSDFSSLEEVLSAIETRFNSALSVSNDPTLF